MGTKNNFRVYETGDLVNISLNNSDAGLGIVLDKIFAADGLEEYYQVQMCNDGCIINCFYYELRYIS